MFQRLSNSWNLLGSTLNVLSHDKELLIFPLLSGIASVAILGTFVGGAWGFGIIDELVQAANQGGEIRLQNEWPLIIGGFVYYFVSFFAMTYFTAALVGAAHIRLTGGDPSVADGLRAANACLPALLAYSAIGATVGLLLKMLENRLRDNFIGQLVVSLVGIAWTLATYLVVPVLVVERRNALDAVKRSGTLLKDTWGEQIIANLGFGLLGFLFALVGFAVLGVGGWLASQAGQSGGLAIFLTAAGVALLYWLLLAIVLSALRGIYTAALYGYVTNQQLRGFPVHLLEGAFRPRARL